MKHLEEIFNIESTDEESQLPAKIIADAREVSNALSVSEKLQSAIAEVRGIEDFENEMNEVSRIALDKCEQLFLFGMRVPERDAGPILAEATKMLKIALEASDAKVKHKLTQVDLLLKQRRLEIMGPKKDDDEGPAGVMHFDRNELFKAIADRKQGAEE
jgi:hypothetical protein